MTHMFNQMSLEITLIGMMLLDIKQDLHSNSDKVLKAYGVW